MLKESGIGAVARNHITHKQTYYAGSACVDDTNMCVFWKNRGDCLRRLQQCRGTNHGLEKVLRVSGGSAKAVKGFWYMMDHVYVDGVWMWKTLKDVSLR